MECKIEFSVRCKYCKKMMKLSFSDTDKAVEFIKTKLRHSMERKLCSTCNDLFDEDNKKATNVYRKFMEPWRSVCPHLFA